MLVYNSICVSRSILTVFRKASNMTDISETNYICGLITNRRNILTELSYVFFKKKNWDWGIFISYMIKLV